MLTSRRIGAINTIMLTIGVLIIGVFLSFVIYSILSKSFLKPEDLVNFVSDDIAHYVNALSNSDGGVKYYSMPEEVEINAEQHSITVSKNSANVTVSVLGELEPGELESSGICIVKKLSTGKIYFFDSSDGVLCNPD